MSKLVQSSAAEIQTNLLETETEIDLALARSAALLASMANARVVTSSPFATGQVAIMRLVKAIGALSDARTGVVRVHADLLRVGQERADFVTIDECPKGVTTTDDAILKLVA